MKWAAVFVAVAGGAWWFGGGVTQPDAVSSEMASAPASEPEADLRYEHLAELGYVDKLEGGLHELGTADGFHKGLVEELGYVRPQEGREGDASTPAPVDEARSKLTKDSRTRTESEIALRSLGYAVQKGQEAAPNQPPQRDEVMFLAESLGELTDVSVALDAEAPEQILAAVGGEAKTIAGGTFRGPGDAVPPAGGGGSNFGLGQEPDLGLSWDRYSTDPQAGAAVAPATPGAPSTPAPPATGAPANEAQALAQSQGLATRPRASGKAPGKKEELGRVLQDSLGSDAKAGFAATGEASGEEFFGDTADGDDDGNGAAYGRFGYVEDLAGERGRRRQRPAEPRLIVIDGYGRRYHDHHVVQDYLCRQPKETPRDMFFRYYGDNPMVRAEEDGLSTFAADVDTASYALARKYLTDGNLPPKAAIRTEEFVNYFNHGLAAPAEEDFAVTIDYAPTPFSGGPGGGMFRFGVKAREVDRESRKPLNLVFVVDRSGSMADGNRIELVKRSLELLVDQLRDDDTVGIVAFESHAHLILEPTPGYERYKIREAVRGLTTGGSTNAEAGLVMGYELAEKAYRAQASNRVVLCSDGVANTGETDQGRILERIQRFSEQQIDLTAIGVGMGNHNDVFLEQIADTGNGACHYVDDFEEAKRVFVERFTGTMQTIARDVKIQVEFNPGVIKRWRQLGYENRAIADADFRNDAVDAGEIGAGHEVIGLYEAEGHIGVAIGDWVAKVRLRWFPDGSREAVETETVLALGEGGSRFELADPRFRLGAVAAQYAEVLRRSYWAREDSYSDLVVEAEKLARDLPKDPQVRELRDMILLTRKLVEQLPPRDDLAILIDEARRLRLLEAEVDQVENRSTELEARLGELRQRNDELEQQIRDLLGG